MAKGRDVFVSPDKKSDLWRVEVIGSKRAAGVFTTREAAIERARRIAQNNESELVVKRRDGTFGLRNSYGGDRKRDKG